MSQSLPSPSAALRLQIDNSLQIERAAFGAKVRAVRAILSLSQDEFARQIGLTQKSVHRIEQGNVEPKLRTIATIEQFWRDSGVTFEHLPDGGFRLVVRGALLRA